VFLDEDVGDDDGNDVEFHCFYFYSSQFKTNVKDPYPQLEHICLSFFQQLLLYTVNNIYSIMV